MRTTVSIQDEALELCKKKAQEQAKTLGEVISEAIFFAFRKRPNQGRAKNVTLPVSGNGGLRPGVDLDCSAALEDIMEERT